MPSLANNKDQERALDKVMKQGKERSNKNITFRVLGSLLILILLGAFLASQLSRR